VRDRILARSLRIYLRNAATAHLGDEQRQEQESTGHQQNHEPESESSKVEHGQHPRRVHVPYRPSTRDFQPACLPPSSASDGVLTTENRGSAPPASPFDGSGRKAMNATASDAPARTTAHATVTCPRGREARRASTAFSNTRAARAASHGACIV